MSDHQDSISNSDLLRSSEVPIKLKLHICLFSKDKQFINVVKQSLEADTYNLTVIKSSNLLIDLVKNQREKIDCLLLKYLPETCQLFTQLKDLSILLPSVIVYQEESPLEEAITLYHPAEVKFNLSQQEKLSVQLNLALTNFLNLTPHHPLEEQSTEIPKARAKDTIDSLSSQQHRLTEKLKERLGYLCVFYKRNPQDFYRNLPQTEQEALEEQLATEYRNIIITYFDDEPKTNINQSIDRFVNLAFFSDISVSKVLEIHMDLMDEFAQQLKLEGRNEDILLDYRLALIDIIAHLCEMYRRSIPREDIPLDVLFKRD